MKMTLQQQGQNGGEIHQPDQRHLYMPVTV